MAKKKDQSSGYLGLKPLEETVEAVLFTPYIADEKPVSLLVVAKPEAGKTAVLKSFRCNRGIAYITDCTAYGLTRDILPKISAGEIKTIIIPDLLTPLSKSTKTRHAFIGFLNALIEEGIAKITTYTTVWEKEVKCNIITSVTKQELFDARHDWAKLGFLSRFLIFSYDYPLSLVMQIFHFYSTHGYFIVEKKLKIPDGEVDVELPLDIAERLTPIAMSVGAELGSYGFRTKINLRSFIKALALKEGRKKVTEEDFKKLLYLVNWLNLKCNPIIG